MVRYEPPLTRLKADVKNFRAGNVSNCLHEWKKITNDKYILEVIEKGVTMEFEETPECKFESHIKFSETEKEIIGQEISKLQEKGVIIPTNREQGDFVSGIFTRPKKDGNHRMILNLKKFNAFLKFKHCKLESINDALNLVSEGCYFGSVDLKDAYYSIPIHLDYQKYLKLCWEQSYFKYVALPNGFAPAVRVFTKITSPPFKKLRSQGHVSVKYLDDSILLGETWVVCLENIKATVDLLQKLGFTIHPEKSVLVPTQRITFLGFIIDSVSMTITLTNERKLAIRSSCENILSNYKVTIREVARTLGLIVSSFTAVPFGQLWYRELEKCKTQSLKRTGGDFDKIAYVSKDAAVELLWWKNNIMDSFAPIKQPSVDYVIYSDASLEGWGGTDSFTEIGGRWGILETQYHINTLELLAAFYCLKSFCRNKTGIHVLLKLDNTTAVSYINKKGGTISYACNEMAKAIWTWAISKNIWLSAAHVPGATNTIADKSSRKFDDNKEWSINDKVIKLLFKKFEKPDVDLFASRLNAKCSKFVSYKPDPFAYQVNAFSIQWTKLKSYIFPPFSIIGKVLAKIVQDQATALVIVPCWQTQPWFPQFMRLVKQGTKPILVKAHPRLLQLPMSEAQHPIWDRLNLIAACLCGTSQWKGCRKTFQESSVHHGDQAHKLPIICQSKDGWNIAPDGNVIPNIQL